MAKIPQRAPQRNALADQLTAYQPTLRDRAANALLRFAGDNYQNQSLVGNLLGSHGLGSSGMGLIDFTPAGLPFAADEGGRKIANGRVASGLLDVGLAAIPIPAAAKGAKAVAGAAKKAGGRVPNALSASVPRKPPIVAYHGSPHKFDAFDSKAIGTGEGAQAYGHGLYFAENEAVAKGYRDQISADGFLGPDGKIWSPQSLRHMNVRVEARRNGANLDPTIARARALLENAPDSTRPLLEADLADLIRIRDAGGIRPNTGHMYQVGINADPNTFLDWDAPLSQQTPEIRAALGDYANEPAGARLSRAMKNPMFAGDIVGANAATPADVSAYLAERGVPGIKYLDAGSRGAGNGSRNYVVFDPQTIEILKRYGIVVPGAGIGAAAYTDNQQKKPGT